MNESDVKQFVGAKIKQLRNKAHLTQFKLGEMIEINQRQIALIESGKSMPSLPTLLKLAKVFNCEISDFFQMNLSLTEGELRDELKKIIDNVDYLDLKRFYSVTKNFMHI